MTNFNQFSFARIYTDLAAQRANEKEIQSLYWFLKDRLQDTKYQQLFECKGDVCLDQAIAIDSIAKTIHEQGDDVLQLIFPGANFLLLKSTLDDLSQYDIDNDIRKFNRGYFTSILNPNDGFIFLEKAELQVGRTTKEDIANAINGYEILYKVKLASPAEILTLARYYPGNQIYQKAALNVQEKPMVVGGPASIEMIDKQKHLITTEALDTAFTNFMKNIRTANINVLHSNVQVGWPLPAYINEQGDVFKSGVDDKGLWVISELRTDSPIAKRVREEIEKGTIKSYSIAGSATKIENVQKGLQSHMRVDELSLAEITLCQQGVNQGAYFNILKSASNDYQYDYDSITRQLRNNGKVAPEYSVVLEKQDNKNPVIVICADRNNSITDELELFLHKNLPNIQIHTRNIQFGEWTPLFNCGIQKQTNKLANANYRPAEKEGIECHTCIFYSDEYCTKLHSKVEPEYVCDYFIAMPGHQEAERQSEAVEQPYEVNKQTTMIDKFVEFVTLGVGDSKMVSPEFNLLIKGDKMPSKLDEFVKWSKTAKTEREKKHADILDYQGFPPKEDFDYEIDNEDEDEEEKVIDIKDSSKPSEG